MPTAHEIVEWYFAANFRPIFWPTVGDEKGPKEKDWTQRTYTINDYSDGWRVGLLTGTEVTPGRFLHDVDIDWSHGSAIAQKFLPPTGFYYGHYSKPVSHCFYLLPEALPSARYEDIDRTCLIELRGTKSDGSLGFQTMVPPSTWSKNGQQEPLTFVSFGPPAFFDSPTTFRQQLCLAAIGMLLAKHLGRNGFGHEPRLAWAGFLLRAGIAAEDLVKMGEVMSEVTNNIEVVDVKTVISTTVTGLLDPKKKIKGGPVLAKILGKNGRAILARINEWLGRESDFIYGQDGKILKDNQENIQRAVRLLDIDLAYQAFSEKLLFDENGHQRILDDTTMDDIWLRIDRDFRFRPTQTFFYTVLRHIAKERSFHPVLDYLSTLTWDSIPRIDYWLEMYGGAKDSDYLQAISSIVLIAAVRRVRQPGCKYDEMLVLESEQGLNKSSALRALCLHDEWFSDDLPLNVDAKQIIERTLGKWIIEASDLVGGRKADRDHLKSMLSRQIDGPARMAYARVPVERPRQFIIIGTTNSSSYLADPTGARRFWPVAVRGFNVELILRDRDQLWAEAAQREASGVSIRLPESLWGDAGAEQDHRREIDAWESPIIETLENIQPSSTGRRSIVTDLLWNALGVEMSRRDRVGALRLSEIMQRLGYTRTRIRVGEKTQVGYVSGESDHTLNFEGENNGEDTLRNVTSRSGRGRSGEDEN